MNWYEGIINSSFFGCWKSLISFKIQNTSLFFLPENWVSLLVCLPLGRSQKTQPSQRAGVERIYYLQQVRRTPGIFFSPEHYLPKQQNWGSFKLWVQICSWRVLIREFSIGWQSLSFTWSKSRHEGQEKPTLSFFRFQLIGWLWALRGVWIVENSTRNCFRLIFTFEIDLRVFTTDVLSLLFLLLLPENCRFFFFFFFGPLPRHFEVSRLGGKRRNWGGSMTYNEAHRKARSLTHWGQGSNPQPHGSYSDSFLLRQDGNSCRILLFP